MSENKPYDTLTVDLIGAASGRATLVDEINELIQRGAVALREKGAGKKATVSIKIELIAHRPDGDVERIDALGRASLKLPDLPSKMTTGYFVTGSADLVTHDHRQRTMLEEPKRTTLSITRQG
jgi:hypothetical protein